MTTKTDLWRCDDCDSEVIFGYKRTQLEVNQIMYKRMPCLDKNFFKN